MGEMGQVLCGRCANQSVQEQQRPRREVPIRPANEDILEPMERGRLGNQGGIGEDRLVQGTIRGVVQGVPRGRV